jgi:hypothetical protein
VFHHPVLGGEIVAAALALNMEFLRKNLVDGENWWG